MFHTVLEGLCPQGWVPYEKCIPTAVLVCLRSHVGLIKASRKSIRKRAYSRYRCSFYFSKDWQLKDAVIIRIVCCKYFLNSLTLPLHNIIYFFSPVKKQGRIACIDGFGRGGYKTDVNPPKKPQMNRLMLQPRNVILPVLTIKPQHSTHCMSVCILWHSNKHGSSCVTFSTLSFSAGKKQHFIYLLFYVYMYI